MSKAASTATKETKRVATSVSEFKKRKKGIPLELPSGLMVVVRRVELTTFLQRGDVPNALLEIVQEALDKGQKMDTSKMINEDEKKIDLDMVNDMFATVGAVCIESVIDPPIHPLVWTEDDQENEDIPEGAEVGDEIEDEDRDDEVLYIDEVEAEDKMFIFQWAVGGTADLATFRRESSEGLAAVARGKKPGKSAKRDSGVKKR
jgi:hypothetical protein